MSRAGRPLGIKSPKPVASLEPVLIDFGMAVLQKSRQKIQGGWARKRYCCSDARRCRSSAAAVGVLAVVAGDHHEDELDCNPKNFCGPFSSIALGTGLKRKYSLRSCVAKEGEQGGTGLKCHHLLNLQPQKMQVLIEP